MKINVRFAFLISIGIASVLLLSIAQVNAQRNNPGPKIGVKGGFNLSQLYIEQPNVEDESNKVGLHFGIFTKIPVTDLISFQPELLYTNTGSKVSYGGTDIEDLLGIEPGELRFNLNYIQLPLALTANLGPLNIHAGPYVSYLVSANVKNLRYSNLSGSESTTLDRNDFNKFDYGLLGGIGFDVRNVTIGVRYNYGLHGVGNNGIARTLTNKSKNSVAQLYLGFGF